MPTEKGESCVVGSAGMRLYSESRNPRYLRDWTGLSILTSVSVGTRRLSALPENVNNSPP